MRGTQGLPSCLPTPTDMLKAHYERELAELKAIAEQMAAALEVACDDDVVLHSHFRSLLSRYNAWKDER